MPDTYPADIDQCPKCGAEIASRDSTKITFACGGTVAIRVDDDGCDYTYAPMLSEECHERAEAQLKARIEELEGKLFKTTDGVVVAIGDTVYSDWFPSEPCVITVGALYRCCSDGMCDPCELGDGADPDGAKYYSTAEAAQAAKDSDKENTHGE